jgi:hypothetical protein
LCFVPSTLVVGLRARCYLLNMARMPDKPRLLLPMQWITSKNLNSSLHLGASILVLVFVSPLWLETDAYRYAALLLFLLVGIHYLTLDPATRRTALSLIGPMNWLCMVWGAYVAARFTYVLIYHPELGIGSAEGIYLFPLFYPLMGYVFLALHRKPEPTLTAFMIVSFVAVVIATDYGSLLASERAQYSLHRNTIHASVANGIIVLLTLPFASYVLRHSYPAAARSVMLMMAAGIFLLGTASIYTLQSKGVWMALGVALPLQFVMSVVLYRQTSMQLLALGVFVAVGIGVAFAAEGLATVAGDTIGTAVLLYDNLAARGGLEAIHNIIADEGQPISARERLMLWMNAAHVWAKFPVFGAGVTWLHHWQFRPYSALPFSLLHNGYAEIMIRYGLTGLLFYGALAIWSVWQVGRAMREGFVSRSAFLAYVPVLAFFCLTLLTNSNNRLAIGESYMWFASAFAFYCYCLRKLAGAAFEEPG